MSSPTRNDDWIDQLLREDAQAGISDDGFSRRVMAALPARPRPLLTGVGKRQLWPLVMTVLGCVIALVLTPGDSFLVQTIAGMSELRAPSSATLATVVTVGLLYWVGIAGALGEN